MLKCDHDGCQRPVTASLQREDGSWEQYCAQHYEQAYPSEPDYKAQRDELARLLRRLLERGDLPPFREQECWIALDKLDQATVKKPSSDEPCERCGGSGEVWEQGAPMRNPRSFPCPDCQPCERCGGEKTVPITPEQFEQGGNGWERTCPDCTEAGA